MEDTRWKCKVQNEDRTKIRQHLLMQLEGAFPNSDHERARLEIERIERNAYDIALSRQEYLETIVTCVSHLEQRERRNHYEMSVARQPILPSDVQENSWKREMPNEDRTKIHQHLLMQLKEAFPNSNHEQLRLESERIEGSAFDTARSRQEYLETVATSITELEQRKRRTHNEMSVARQPTLPSEMQHSWQREMTKESRQRVCQYVLSEIVGFISPSVSDFDWRRLEPATRRFEASMFNTATSVRNYLELVAEKLSMIKQATGITTEPARENDGTDNALSSVGALFTLPPTAQGTSLNIDDQMSKLVHELGELNI